MFSIFKKKKKTATVDLSGIGTDMHSHLLPGIDDGSTDVDTSLQLINGLRDLGYRNLITTPHIMWDMYKNDVSTIEPAKQQVQQALTATASPVALHAAAEYFLDDHFDQLLEKNVPLLTIKDNWLLVEFSFVTAPMNYKEKLFNLQIKGYKPILAHPERYLYIRPETGWYDELKTEGCYFQVNLLSLSGYYGKAAYELARFLLKKQYIDLLGTDMHHTRHLQALQQAGHIMAPVNSLLDSGKLLNTTL
jgi:protein-tyrosine phosphatase